MIRTHDPRRATLDILTDSGHRVYRIAPGCEAQAMWCICKDYCEGKLTRAEANLLLGGVGQLLKPQRSLLGVLARFCGAVADWVVRSVLLFSDETCEGK